MAEPLPIPRLLDEWLKWAEWVRTPEPRADGSELIGWHEFEWITQSHPEYAWTAILAAVSDERCAPYLGTLAAGPMEDLLSGHGAQFIDRVEAQARSDPQFAMFLGGVWRFQMADEVWARVQAVWDRRGWDGILAE